MKTLSTTSYASYTLLFTAAILFSIGLLPALNMGLLLSLSALLYLCTSYRGLWPIIDIGIWLLALLVGFAAATYRPSGFSYPLLWHSAALYEDGGPYSLYINLSKAIGGYLIVVYFFFLTKRHPSAPALSKAIYASIAGAVIILSSGYLFFGIGWQPKLPSGIVYFILINLLVTSVAEEAFFRLLIQEKIRRYFTNASLGIVVSVLISGSLFALSHSGPSQPALALYLIAGLTYSLVYAYTQRFYMAVAVHFGTNLLHFLFLEYPIQLP